MLPSKEDWQIIVSNLGIKNSDHIIVYDNSDVFSSCRVWYTFIYFGHDPNLISVLDGNFEKWLVPGNYVSLVSSGKHTGTIYKYLGKENNGIPNIYFFF